MTCPVCEMFHISYLYSSTKHEIIEIKITIYYVVWTRLTRAGCFNWLAHYKRMRIVKKYMGVVLQVYSVNFKHNDKSGKRSGGVEEVQGISRNMTVGE